MRTPHRYPDRSGINRYGEENILPDYYDDETGVRHSRFPLDHGIAWSSDPRSEASRERHHHQKGSWNFSRGDDPLREEVCKAFLNNPSVEATNIGVKVHAGIVTLEGHVRNRMEMRAAEMTAVEVPGVLEVINELRIP